MIQKYYRLDNPAYFDIRYPAGYQIVMPDIQCPAFVLAGYPTKTVSGASLITGIHVVGYFLIFSYFSSSILLYV
jgi:hypothetical protein